MNRWQIEQAKQIARMQKKVKELVPEIYASFVIACDRRGWNAEQIEDLFIETQVILNEYATERGTMVEKAEELTGICLRSEAYIGEENEGSN